MYKIIKMNAIKLTLEEDNTDILTWMALADIYEEEMNESASNICRTIIDCLKWAQAHDREPSKYKYLYIWSRYNYDSILRSYTSSLIPVIIYQYLMSDEYSKCLAYSTRNKAWSALFQAWIESKSK